MRLHLDRITSDNDSTIGCLYVDGKFFCFTCEDEKRETKVARETRIPQGRRQITLRTEGGFHERYTRQFGADFHKGMLWIRDVPQFEYVLIHIGNDDDDTEGCVLVGLQAHVNSFGGGIVGQSKDAYMKLYPIVRDALLRGEEVYIDVTDGDLT